MGKLLFDFTGVDSSQQGQTPGRLLFPVEPAQQTPLRGRLLFDEQPDDLENQGQGPTMDRANELAQGQQPQQSLLKPSTLEDAKQLELWPSPTEALKDVSRGLAMTAARVGSLTSYVPGMGALGDFSEKMFEDMSAEKPDSVVGKVLQDGARFALGQAIVGKVLGPLGSTTKLGRFMLGATGGDLLAFPGNEERLSNTLAEHGPRFSQPLFDFLAADPNDSTAEGKMKQAIEGVLAGGVIDSTVKAAGFLVSSAVKLRGRILTTAQVPRPNVPSDPRVKAVADKAVVRDDMLNIWSQKNSYAGGILAGHQADKFAQVFVDRLRNLDQAGVYTPEALKAEYDDALKMFQENRRPAKPMAPGFYVNAVSAERKKLADIAEKKPLFSFTEIKNKLTRQFVDSSGPLMGQLASTPDGTRAVQAFSLARGATQRGSFYARKATDEVFGDLDKQELGDLSDLIRVQRDIAIKSRKPDYMLPLEVPSVKSTRSVKDVNLLPELDVLRTRLGDPQFNKLLSRSNEYFNHMRNAVDVLHDSGIVNEATRDKLQWFNYSPTKFIDEALDPAYPELSKLTNPPLSTRGSGIPFLKNGDMNKLLETDPRFLLSEVVARAHARAAKNEAGQALFEAAQGAEMSGLPFADQVVRITKPEKAHEWQKISTRIAGEDAPIYIHKDYINDWVINLHSVDSTMRALGIAAGAPITRAMATGYNPLFAIKNIPRDAMLSWMAGDRGQLYSVYAPMFAAQMANDMKTVVRDAWTKTGRYEDYLKEGGGMYLLAHQGRIIAPDATMSSLPAWKRYLQHFERYAGKVNEFQETTTRLALRERAIRNMTQNGQLAVTPEMQKNATYIARDFMDYSRGGMFTKRVDQLVPYSAARVEGYATMVRSAKAGPVKYAARTAQLIGAFSAWWLENHYMAGNRQTEISPTDRANNITILSPQTRIDSMGNPRQDYLKIPIDQSTTPIKAFTDAVLDKMFYGKQPDSLAYEAMKSITSLVPFNLTEIPTVRAIAALKGQDLWTNQAVWNGDPALPPAYHINKDTPAWARGLGSATGAAFGFGPAELNAAVNALGGSNPFAQLFAAAGDAASNAEGHIDFRSQTLGDFIRQVPGMRSFVGQTHPLNALNDQMQEQMAPAAIAKQQVTNKYNDGITQIIGDSSKPMSHEQLQAGAKFLLDNKDQFGSFLPMLRDRLEAQYKLDAVFKTGKVDYTLVKPPAFWLDLTARDPAIRADLFLSELANVDNMQQSDDPSVAERGRRAHRQLLRVAGALGGFDPKQSAAFGFRLHKEAKDRGLDLE